MNGSRLSRSTLRTLLEVFGRQTPKELEHVGKKPWAEMLRREGRCPGQILMRGAEGEEEQDTPSPECP